MSVEVAPQTARAVRFTETGGPEVLHLDQVTVPAPAANEIRLQVKAIGLNRADTMFRRGMYLETPIFPRAWATRRRALSKPWART